MKTKKTIRTVKGADHLISYELVQKNIKNMYLRLREDGTISVSASRWIPLQAVDEFVLRNLGFIENRQEKLEQEVKKREAQEQLQYVTGETVRIFGKEVPFELVEGHRPSVMFVSAENGDAEPYIERVIMNTPAGYDAERRKRLYLKELKKCTEKWLLEICARVWPLFKPYGVDWPEIAFRSMKSRWGSCQPQGKKITLNLRLIEKPYAAAEYVVVHEFAHFLHADHSPRFWAVVEYFMPDHKARRKMLK